MKIDFTPFLGEMPQFDPAQLPPNTATCAFNVMLDRGSLEPFHKPLVYKASTKTGTQNTVYRFGAVSGDPDSGWLLSWEEVCHVVPGPVSGNDQELTYWTGQDYPRYADNSIATGAGPLPANSYQLGVSAPEYGPFVELTERPPDDDREWDPEVWYEEPPVWWPRMEPVFWPDPLSSGYFKFLSRHDWPDKKPAGWPLNEPSWWPDNWPPTEPVWWPEGKDEYPLAAPYDWPEDKSPPEWWPKEWEWIYKDHWPTGEPEWWPPIWQIMYSTGSSDERDEVDRDYVITFTQQLGSLVMEGPPSSPSNMIKVNPDIAVKVSNLARPPSGNYPWHGRRLYRRIYSGGITQYGLVAELGLTDEVYIDSLHDAEVPGDLLVSQYHDPPPDGLHSLGVLSNGMMFGAHEKDCCVCEPYLPHAWNPFARYPFPHRVVGCGVADNNIVVVTQKNPYLLTGVQPTQMSSVELHLEQGCVSARSVTSGSFGCVYASPDGLVNISTRGSSVITEGLFTRDQWLALNPSSMICAVVEETVLCCYRKENGERGTLMLKPAVKQAGVWFTDQVFTAACRDGLLDSLIVYQEDVPGQFQLWDRGEALTYTWRSALRLLPKPLNFTAVRVEADSYSHLIFRLVIGGQVKAELTIQGRREYRLPGGYCDRRVQVEVESRDRIRLISIAEAPGELS
ncbi:MAG: hypothetical protein JAY71_18750 [Candidatus Thiodiazotropha weberae]|nr:hypothetical protein [Candidatus Thiodiazotropha weberae]